MSELGKYNTKNTIYNYGFLIQNNKKFNAINLFNEKKKKFFF